MERELLQREPVLDKKGRPLPGFSRKSTLIYRQSAAMAVKGMGFLPDFQRPSLPAAHHRPRRIRRAGQFDAV